MLIRLLGCAAALSLLIPTTPASAAVLSQISWDVTEGTFFGPVSTGPIAGGTVTWTAPGGAVSTPISVSTPPAGTLNFVLTGPSGAFSIIFPATQAFVNPAIAGAKAISFVANVTSGGVSLGNVHFYQGVANGYSGGGYGFIDLPGDGHHNIGLGEEVRTYLPAVPGPGIAVMPGLGLMGLGALAGGRGVSARLRLKDRG